MATVRAVFLVCSLLVYSATVQNTPQYNAAQEEIHEDGIVKRQINQTSCGEYKHCDAWQKNGFCNNSFYPYDLKLKWCGRLCGLC